MKRLSEQSQAELPYAKKRRNLTNRPPAVVSGRLQRDVRASSQNTPSIARTGMSGTSGNTGASNKELKGRRCAEAEDLYNHRSHNNIAAVLAFAQPRLSKAKKLSEKLANEICKNINSDIANNGTNTQQQIYTQLNKSLNKATQTQNKMDLLSIIRQWTRYENDNSTSSTLENVLYPMFSALVVYVALHLNSYYKNNPHTRIQAHNMTRSSTTSESVIKRLLLPHGKGDFIPSDVDEEMRIDGALVMHPDDHNVELYEKIHCRDIFAVAEAKKSATMQKDAVIQAISYNHSVYSTQPNRRFTWSLTVCATQVCACLLLHDTVLVSESMDIATDSGRLQLIQLLVNWSICDQLQLGYDPTIRYNANEHIWIIDCFDDLADTEQQQQQHHQLGKQQKSTKIDSHPIHYRVCEFLFRANRIEGRHTRCFLAVQCDDDGEDIDNDIVVIKDAWATTHHPPEQDERSEIKILHRISEQLSGTPGIDHLYPMIKHGGHVRFMVDSKMKIDTTDTIFELLSAKRVDSPEHPQQEHGDDNNDNDVFSTHHSDSMSKNTWNCQPLRAHRRIAMTPVGNHIHLVESQEEFIIVLADAMRCHSSIHKHCQTLHRDISENNILVVEGNEVTPVQGLLIDFDYGITLNTVRKGMKPERSGTLPYMSIGNLENNSTPRTALDDWESLLYLICWCATVGLKSEMRRAFHQKEELKDPDDQHRIFKWTRGRVKTIAYQKRMDMDTKRNFTSSILIGFCREYTQLMELAYKLHEVLFLHKGCEGALTFDKDYMKFVNGTFIYSLPIATDDQPIDPLTKRVQYEQVIVKELNQIMSNYRQDALRRIQEKQASQPQ